MQTRKPITEYRNYLIMRYKYVLNLYPITKSSKLNIGNDLMPVNYGSDATVLIRQELDHRHHQHQQQHHHLYYHLNNRLLRVKLLLQDSGENSYSTSGRILFINLNLFYDILKIRSFFYYPPPPHTHTHTHTLYPLP